MADNGQVDFRVVQLLSSRLCHDLAGPAGAVHNGMELLQESVGDDDGALGLVAMSVGQLTARLGFFRLAFGLGGSSGRKPALEEARDLATGFLAGGRTALDWPDLSGVSAVDEKRIGDAAKVLLNMILFGADSLPRGGTLGVQVTVSSDNPAAIGLAVRAVGQGAFIKDDRMAALDSGAVDGGLSAQTVQGHFMARLAESLGGEIEVSLDTDEVQIAALLPTGR